jgi:hypothetical protein
MSNLSWESNPAIFLAGTLRFRHHLLVSTYVSNTTVSALKGASCFQHHLQWLDGITSLILQVSQYLRLFFRSFLLLLLGRAGGLLITLSCSLKLSNNVRLDACSDRNAESASTNSNSMPVQRARLIYDAEMLLSSEPETSCFKASQSFSRSNISTPIRIGEVLQQNPYLSRLVLLDLLRY